MNSRREHRTDVTQQGAFELVPTGRVSGRWTASCSCGWFSCPHRTRDAAERDANRHKENPQS